MRQYIITVCLFFLPLLPLAAQDAGNDNKDEEVILLGLRSGFTLGGIGTELKGELSAAGLVGQGQSLWGQNFPKAFPAILLLIEAEYKKNNLGGGLEYGLADWGSAAGLIDESSGGFGFPDRLPIRHKVVAVTPFLRVYLNKVGFFAGPSFNWWEVKSGNATPKDSQNRGNNVGFLAGGFLTIVEDKDLRMNAQLQYRYMGSHEVGPYYDQEGFLDSYLMVFSQRKVTLNFLSLDLSLSFKLWNKQ